MLEGFRSGLDRGTTRRNPSMRTSCWRKVSPSLPNTRSDSTQRTGSHCSWSSKRWTLPARTAPFAHVLTGLNPTGFQVFSFKAPNTGRAGPRLSLAHRQGLAGSAVVSASSAARTTKRSWPAWSAPVLPRATAPAPAYAGRRAMEAALRGDQQLREVPGAAGHSGRQDIPACVKEEQRLQQLERIDTPEKNWKFNPGDIEERKYWKEYMKAFEDVFNHTSTSGLPGTSCRETNAGSRPSRPSSPESWLRWITVPDHQRGRPAEDARLTGSTDRRGWPGQGEVGWRFPRITRSLVRIGHAAYIAMRTSGKDRHVMPQQTLILIRGAGDLASRVAARLHRSRYAVAMTEVAQPLMVRRAVCFGEAVYDEEAWIEGIGAGPDHIRPGSARHHARRHDTVLVDPGAQCRAELAPATIVDGIMAKRNTGTTTTMRWSWPWARDTLRSRLPLCHRDVAGLARPADLEGSAAPDAGEPGEIAGQGSPPVAFSCRRRLQSPDRNRGPPLRPARSSPRSATCRYAPRSGGVVRGLMRSGLRVAA